MLKAVLQNNYVKNVNLRPYINGKSVVLKKPLNVDHVTISVTVTTSITLLQEFIRCNNKQGELYFNPRLILF